jgi:hypothetical protein
VSLLEEFCQEVSLPPPIPIGPRTVWEQLLRRCHDRATHRYKAQCQNPNRKIEIGFIAAPQLNAWAATWEDTDLIGINVGTYLVLCDLFDRMLGHPNLFPKIGNPRAETLREIAEIKTSIENATKKNPFAPQDAERAKYAGQLMLLAFDFLFQHEFGHIFNGHTDWLNQTLGFCVLAEVGASAIPGLSGLDLQTLEMDADSFATLDGFSRLNLASYNGFFGSANDAAFALLLSHYCVWRLFAEHVDGDVDAILSEDHPPAVYRQRFNISYAIDLLLRDGIWTENAVGEQLSAVVFAAEVAFKTLTGVPIAREINAPDTYEKGGDLLGRLTENWKLLRPQLDLVKRGGVLAP